ncbi:hypothetical protein DRO42_03640 [Candidatus Bathyarchaeota archaeon]|nr:MAG: hypothetical protein DRO42_03640 [Candidatus Bathyarchaeota archaeon]
MTEANKMRRLVIKGRGRLWPTVTWRDSQLVVYYLGEDADDTRVEETREIDFEKLLLRLDRGDSVFITTKPRGEWRLDGTETREECRWC